MVDDKCSDADCDDEAVTTRWGQSFCADCAATWDIDEEFSFINFGTR